jgi:hypothetical protein
MDSENRRTHFRAQMAIPVTWQVLTDNEIELLESEMAWTLLKQAEAPSPINEFLAQATPGSKEEQLYRCLQLINSKIDFVIGQLFFEPSENPPNKDEVIEISGSGLKFITKVNPGAGAFLRMNLILPGTFLFQVGLIAEVVRVDQSGQGHRVATRIVEIEEAAKDAIIKVVFQKQREEIRRSKILQGDQDVR